MPKLTFKNILLLRLMVVVGVLSMLFFWWQMLHPGNKGDNWLYGLLLVSLFIISAKLLHEWYHYWHISVPDKPQNPQQFTVDVLTTFCPGEPYEMIENCLRAIQAMPYPHTTYLCDEANDPQLKKLCAELGINHVTRNNRKDAKAGNINNALKQAKGEICLILDPDHLVEPNFLDEIAPYFTNPEVGFVQTVQAYHNIHQTLISKGAAQQTFQFYGPLMMSMNSYGTVQAIGANCTFRRAALDSIGGHAPGLAEDMHTSMLLHAQGWKSVYVPQILARGQVPSTLSAYLKQQLKWSRGVFELLLRVYPNIAKKLTGRQRFHYGILPFFYLISLAFLVNFFLPIFSIFTGNMPARIDLVEFTLIGLPLFITALAVRHYAQHWLMEERERGFHIVGGLLLIGTWWIHLTGFVFALLQKKVPYNPTPKNNKEKNNWPLILPNVIILLLSLAAGIKGFLDKENPYIFMMATLAFFNVLFMLFYVVAGRQQQYRKIIDTNTSLAYWDTQLRKLRTAIWIFNHQLFSKLRSVAAALVILAAGLAYYFLWNWPTYKYQLVATPQMKKVISFYRKAELNNSDNHNTNTTALFSENHTIIPPAKVLFEKEEVMYWAAKLRNEQWYVLNKSDSGAASIKWYLVRFASRSNGEGESNKGTRLRYLGNGASVKLKIPERQALYRLLMETKEYNTRSQNRGKRYVMRSLHTPFPDYSTLLSGKESLPANKKSRHDKTSNRELSKEE